MSSAAADRLFLCCSCARTDGMDINSFHSFCYLIFQINYAHFVHLGTFTSLLTGILRVLHHTDAVILV